MTIQRKTRVIPRRGVSRLDVVAILLISLLLLAVFFPAVGHQKKTATVLVCLNNMRNVGMSIIAFEASSAELPPLVGEISNEHGKMDASWPIMLLPMLDESSLFKRIKANCLQESGVLATIADGDRVCIPIFTCPLDQDSFSKPGGLSYVVNAGFMSRDIYHGDPSELHRLGHLSWNGNSVAGEEIDVKVSAATGIFWRPHQDFHPTLTEIEEGDGLDFTMMVTENLQAGNWYDTDTARISFGLPIDAKGGQVSFGPGTFFESVNKPLNTEFAGGTLASATPHDWQINCEKTAKVGMRPRPSSRHNGRVNVIMCSGAGRILSETIDPHVFVKLITPRGSEFGEGGLASQRF